MSTYPLLTVACHQIPQYLQHTAPTPYFSPPAGLICHIPKKAEGMSGK